MSEYVGKDFLKKEYLEILRKGELTSEQIDSFLARKPLGEDVIIQASSGSTSEPLLIPRSKADVADIAKRVIRPYVESFRSYPERIALFGGISHTEAAVKLQMGSISMRSFQLEESDRLDEFDPHVVSCYPSVIRELIDDGSVSLSGLKAIKLGGERIYSSDLKKIFQRFPGILLIEQYGSTEMPAVALRTFTNAEDESFYLLQNERFAYQIPLEIDGWHPLVVRDNFPGLLFPIGRFYDMGDDVLCKSGRIVDVRRRGDRSFEFREEVEQLLDLGLTNVQIDTNRAEVFYSGASGPGSVGSFSIKGKKYSLLKQKLNRIHPSNKLPVLV
ncbi:AMP-binding protein [Leptospira ellisii]|uniref:AMP-binding protein n=1 Tax=Leptospira ellisii TaxID=2023197 RepID=A0A2N0BA45_9LEPT|nr:AMP-binding protein [Leptospira ellisii]MDV6235487.1 AMP-binding protein [Leptospira ellisii]PJZ93401.1 hypothetical protein CH379_07995 [Leptospira ellisii]PKA06227.1 hypothetical protein CH375_00695 [Leptospira ellisii]